MSARSRSWMARRRFHHTDAARASDRPGAAVTRTGEGLASDRRVGGADMVRAGRARLRGYAAIAVVVALVASGCGWLHGPRWFARPIPVAQLGVDAATQTRCDPISPQCMLPFPNDHFTVRDRSTPTGRRLALSSASLPTNASGAPIDVTDENRADGWSPGSQIMVQLPGLDVAASGVPGLADASRSISPTSPIVVLDATTHKRLPFWAELDANADPGQPPILFIRPVSNLEDGHRIVVGMRRLVDASHHRLAPTKAFAAYRDGQRTTDATFESRRPAMDRIFLDLAFAGVHRRDLQLAWDFTVASTRSLTGRMLTIRDDAFHALGSATPAYTVTNVVENPNPQVRRRVEGTLALPLYLTNGGAPGGRFVLGPDGLPRRQPGTFTAQFVCNLPAAAATTPARMALYGHGLFGDLTEVNGGLARTMAEQHDIAYCATNWYGMAEEDLGSAITVLQDLSNMPKIADRLQQGILAFLFLGHLMRDPNGLAANPAFQLDGHTALDTSQLYFDGNSQGAILGGALTAVAQDFTRSTLAEAGMNYSLLLDRSVDFDDYLTDPQAVVPEPIRPAHRTRGRPAPLGSGRDQRLREPRRHAILSPVHHATTSCCSARSVTTRSASTRCASRPRRCASRPMSRSRSLDGSPTTSGRSCDLCRPTPGAGPRTSCGTRARRPHR